ncbi:hypothetical protein Tco_0348462 [Tanacetum coccineum]
MVVVAYLDGSDTESEPLEDPFDTETPKLPLTIAPPTSLSESTPPVLVPILRRTSRMAVRVPPAMSSGLSASMAKVVAMSESAFRTSELVEDSKDDDDEEDEEIEESMDSGSVSEDTEDEGPTAEDEGLATGVKGPGMDDESYGLDNESHGLDDESHGLDDKGHGVESDRLGLEEEAVPGGQQQAAPVVGIAMSEPLGLGYGALRHRESALEEDDVYSTFEVRHGSGSALESERPERVSTSRQPTLTLRTDPEDGMVYIDVPAYPPPTPLPVSSPLTVPSSAATPTAVETKGFLTELGAQVEVQGGLIHDHAVRLEELSPALFERVRVGEGRSDIWSNMETSVSPGVMSSDCERLELAKVVDGMRRGQEPRGDA